MKVTVYDYYPGQLTKDDFYNVTEWDKVDNLNVIMTIEGVENIEKTGDGLMLWTSKHDYNYFENYDFSKIEIHM